MKHFEINEIFEIIENKGESLTELENHIKECKECKENYEKVKEFFKSFEIEVPLDVKLRIRKEVLKRERKKKKIIKTFVPALVTLSLIFVILFKFMIKTEKEIIIISPSEEEVLTPEEVLFVFKIKDTKGLKVFIDSVDISDSLKKTDKLLYYLAEDLELNPGTHYLTVFKDNKIYKKNKFYLTSFKFSFK